MIFIFIYPSHRRNGFFSFPFISGFKKGRIYRIFQNNSLLLYGLREKLHTTPCLQDHPVCQIEQAAGKKPENRTVILLGGLSPYGNRYRNSKSHGSQNRHHIIFSNEGNDHIRFFFFPDTSKLLEPFLQIAKSSSSQLFLRRFRYSPAHPFRYRIFFLGHMGCYQKHLIIFMIEIFCQIGNNSLRSAFSHTAEIKRNLLRHETPPPP